MLVENDSHREAYHFKLSRIHLWQPEPADKGRVPHRCRGVQLWHGRKQDTEAVDSPQQYAQNKRVALYIEKIDEMIVRKLLSE